MAENTLTTVLRHLRGVYAAQAQRDLDDGELLERFLASKEESAFAILVQRHGPMVLAVCQRLLRDRHAAEDAFQATFLVLLRRSASLRRTGSLANWLYGVAQRVARRARARDMAQRSRERQAAAMPKTQALDETTWQELRLIVDEEISALPEHQRTAVVLCYLEGKSYEQAAKELGWPKSSLARRLGRGRDLLRERLVARGMTLSGAALAAALAENSAGATLPALLTLNTVKGAVLVAAGKSAAAALSAQAIALAEESMKGIAGVKSAVFAVLLASGMVAGGVGLAGYEWVGTKPAATAQSAAAEALPSAGKLPSQIDRSPAVRDQAKVTITGRVLDPSGRPVPGAKVFFVRSVIASPPGATEITDADGSFQLSVSRSGYRDANERTYWMHGAVVAAAKDFAFGSVGEGNAEDLTKVTIRLAAEAPIEGRVVDLQGHPIAGVSVNVQQVRFWANGANLQDLVEDLKSRKPHWAHWPNLKLDPPIVNAAPTVTTAADGRFRLRGLRADCVALLRFEGPTIETTEEYAITRPAPSMHLAPNKGIFPTRGEVFHGMKFDHIAAPTRPIEGVVRDKDTGKPLAGVTIENEMYRRTGQGPLVRVITDPEGRYRLVGLASDGRHSLLAVPPSAQPYLCAALTAKPAGALGPVRLDFSLKRAVVIRGRVTDKETRLPVSAVVVYYAFSGNPNLRQAPGFRDSHTVVASTGADGSFTVLGLPGPGLVAVSAANREQEGRYLIGAGADGIQGRRENDSFITHPAICHAWEYNALTEINPARDADSVVCNVALDRGKTVSGTVVGPDGEALTGVKVQSVLAGRLGGPIQTIDLPTAQFCIPGVDPKHPRSFFFHHQGKHLAAAVVLRGSEPMPATVHLQKCATITGRIVDVDGVPCPAYLMGFIQPGQLTGAYGAFSGQAEKDGHFRIEGIIPGLRLSFGAGTEVYSLDQPNLVPELKLEPGEVRNLGDLKRKPMK